MVDFTLVCNKNNVCDTRPTYLWLTHARDPHNHVIGYVTTTIVGLCEGARLGVHQVQAQFHGQIDQVVCVMFFFFECVNPIYGIHAGCKL